jgi:hypothetical protein
MFWGCSGSKPAHGPQPYQTEKLARTLDLGMHLFCRMSFLMCKYVLGCVTVCEIMRKIHVAQLLLTPSVPNVEPTHTFELGVVIYNINGI